MKQNFEQISVLEDSYSVHKKFNHPIKEQIQICLNPDTNQKLFAENFRISDQKDLDTKINHIQKNISLKNSNLLNILDYSCKTEKGLCSTSYLLRIFYDCPQTDLHKEMLKRRKSGKGFSNIFITILFYEQLQAHQYLEKQGIYHGNISPFNIALNEEKKISQLINVNIKNVKTQEDYLNIQKNNLVQGHDLYQSPEVFEMICQNNLKKKIKINDEETYSLGLILLECGLNKTIQDIYDKKSKKFNRQKLKIYFKEFSDKFFQENVFLTTAIEHMVNLDKNPEKSNFDEILESSPDFQEVKEYFKQYHSFENSQLQYNEIQSSHQFQNNMPYQNEVQVSAQFQNNNKVQAFSQQNQQFQNNLQSDIQNHSEQKKSYISHVKHEYRKNGQVIEPETIVEDRTVYVPHLKQFAQKLFYNFVQIKC